MEEDTTVDVGIHTNQVAIINFELVQSLVVYPNPAGNFVYIESESILSDAAIMYLIDINVRLKCHLNMIRIN